MNNSLLVRLFIGLLSVLGITPLAIGSDIEEYREWLIDWHFRKAFSQQDIEKVTRMSIGELKAERAKDSRGGRWPIKPGEKKAISREIFKRSFTSDIERAEVQEWCGYIFNAGVEQFFNSYPSDIIPLVQALKKYNYNSAATILLKMHKLTLSGYVPIKFKSAEEERAFNMLQNDFFDLEDSLFEVLKD